jgi:galactose mutarotase-like enzyme
MSDDWLTLRSHALTARIDPQGAQLSSLRDGAGNELLWQGDPAVWAGRAPILFPIVGTLAGGSYLHAGKRYALPRHGFARGRRFTVVDADAASALLRLVADEATLAVYPFAFELDIAFALRAAALTVTATVRNVGDEPLYASVGFHPGFQWPLPYGQPRAAHFLEFDADEPAPVRRINADGLLTAQPHATPLAQRRLALDDTLFRDDVLIFEAPRSRSVSYGAELGPRIVVDYPDASWLGLWSKPGAGFVCIEPWQGVTDLVGDPGGLHVKAGSFAVAPSQQHSLRMTLRIESDGRV